MKKTIYSIIIALLLVSCHSGRQYFPKDVEPATVEFLRFDSAFIHISQDSAEAREGIRQLWADYPELMPDFLETVIGVAATDTDYLCTALPLFLSDTLYGFKQTNQLEQELFADVQDIKAELETGFGRLKYLYPETVVPQIYLFVSGFNSSLFMVRDGIAVGADMYLGADYPYYNRVAYEYQKPTMSKEYIPGDVLAVYLFNNIPYTSAQNRLLDNMIYRGKVMYLLSLLLPEEKPWKVMGYSKEQWQWCERNEAAIWKLMLDKQDLFRSETMIITSYLNDGPFTSEISQDSPARLGTWIGWRITEDYMNNHPEVSLQELMLEGDAQKILEQSNYRP